MTRHITTWDPIKEDAYIFQEDNIIYLNPIKLIKFSRGMESKIESLFTFKNGKVRKLFTKELPTIVNYIDYFIEFYDIDKELIPIYIKLKIDMERNLLDDPNVFIKTFTGYVFRNSNLKKQVIRLVEDNYTIDITKTSDRTFTGSKDFTNAEAKLLLGAAMMMKLFVPPLAHNIATNKTLSIETRHELISDLFSSIFHKMCNDEQAQSIVLKMYYYVSGKVETHSKTDSEMWDKQGAIGGWTESSFIDDLLNSHILYLNLFKLHFDKNIMAFIKSIVEDQLSYNVSRVKHKKNIIGDVNLFPELISNIDKWEQLMIKLDESQIIFTEMAINKFMDLLERSVRHIGEDEVKYYMDHVNLNSKFHSELIFLIYAKRFGGFRELHNIGRDKYVKMMIVLKEYLANNGYTMLNHILTANVEASSVKRNKLLKNSTFIVSIKDSSLYKHLVNESYVTLNLKSTKLDDNPILTKIKFVITHDFTYVDYENKHLLGQRIKIDNTIAIDELLTFIDEI